MIENPETKANFTSLVFAFMGSENYDQVAKEMLEAVLKFIDKGEGKNMKAREVIFATKDRDQYKSLQKAFREKVDNWINSNQIFIEKLQGWLCLIINNTDGETADFPLGRKNIDRNSGPSLPKDWTSNVSHGCQHQLTQSVRR